MLNSINRLARRALDRVRPTGVGARLQTAFAVIAFLSLIAAGIGWLGISEAARVQTDIQERRLPLLLTASALTRAGHGLVDLSRDIAGAANPQALNDAERKLHRHEAELANLVTNLRELDAPPERSAAALAHIAMMRATIERQIAAQRQALEHGVKAPPAALTENDGLTAVGEQLLNDSRTAIGEQMLGVRNLAVLHRDRLAGIFIVSALGTTLLIWLLVNRGIIGRFTRLAWRMEGLAQGDTDTPVQIDGKDEISQMARAVEQFRMNAVALRGKEHLLHRQREALQLVFDNIPISIWLKDDRNNVIRVNRHAAADVGRSVAELEYRPLSESLPEYAEIWGRNEQQILFSNQPQLGVMDVVERNGKPSYRRVDRLPYTDPMTGERRILIISVDITELKNAETRLTEIVAALAASEQRFDLAARGAEVGIWDWVHIDEDRQYWSPVCYQLLGYENGEFPASTTTTLGLMHPDDRPSFLMALEGHLKQRQPFRPEYRLRAKNGEYRWFSAAGQASWNVNGKAVRMSGSITDIHHRKRYEEIMLRQAEELRRSNAELEQFAYIASHDLQEPLRMVSSYCELLTRRYADRLDDDGREFLGYAVDGAYRMRSLISELLTYSRVGRAELDTTECDLAALIDEITLDLKLQIAERHAVIVAENLPTVLGDRGQLRRVLLNLINNAIKFNDDPSPEVAITATADAREWRISVSDNGIGIDPRYAEHIFEIFKRLHGRADYPGTGIGLAICRRVIDRHGGRIWLDAGGEGQGSSFTFTLPRSMIVAHEVEDDQ